MKKLWEKFARKVEATVCFWWQRQRRGFDSSELWSLDYSILKFTLPRLRAFQEETYSYPPNLTFEEWQVTLGKMVRAIELYLEYDGLFYDYDASPPVKKEALEAEFEEGWVLFHEYFFSLWI